MRSGAVKSITLSVLYKYLSQVLTYLLKPFSKRLPVQFSIKSYENSSFNGQSWNYIRSTLKYAEMNHFQMCIFVKLIISLLLSKYMPGLILTQVPCVFGSTLSNKSKKRIFEYYGEVSPGNVLKKLAKFVDCSCQTLQALDKNHFTTLCCCRNYRENILLQHDNKPEYILIIFHLNHKIRCESIGAGLYEMAILFLPLIHTDTLFFMIQLSS